MRLNSELKIVGNKVILVPYGKHHVPRYHEWMKSEELQALTASEPLTLDQEFSMQDSWMQDDDKCTFIILEKSTLERTNDEIESMVGDTNIFLKHEEKLNVGEIEIMIAEKQYRGNKLGWESVILMLLYGIEHLKLRKFEAKISTNNLASITMFEKLQFTEISRSDVFKEITLGKIVDKEWYEWLSNSVNFKILEYKFGK